MAMLKLIDPMSAAKIAAIVYLIGGFVAALFIVPVIAAISSTYQFNGIGALALLIIIPVSALISGFIIFGIGSVVYNIVVKKFGGIIVDIKSGRLARVEPFSLGKIAAIGGAIGGFVLGIVFAVMFAVIGAAGGSGLIGAFGFAAIVVLPMVFAIVFFVIYAIDAIIYNFLAAKIGGVAIVIRDSELRKVGAASYAKINGCIGAIFGLVQGILVAAQSSYATRLTHIGAYTAALHTLGLAAVIILPVSYFILGFVVSLVEAWVYNFAAKRIGGARITLS